MFFCGAGSKSVIRVASYCKCLSISLISLIIPFRVIPNTPLVALFAVLTVLLCTVVTSIGTFPFRQQEYTCTQLVFCDSDNGLVGLVIVVSFASSRPRPFHSAYNKLSDRGLRFVGTSRFLYFSFHSSAFCNSPSHYPVAVILSHKAEHTSPANSHQSPSLSLIHI